MKANIVSLIIYYFLNCFCKPCSFLYAPDHPVGSTAKRKGRGNKEMLVADTAEEMLVY